MKNSNFWFLMSGISLGALVARTFNKETLRKIVRTRPGVQTRELRVFRRSIQLPSPKLQYLILPYMNIRIDGIGEGADHFKIGPYSVWKDTNDNWQTQVGLPRPTKHLEMYVDRAGKTLSDMWIITAPPGMHVEPERWQQVVAALFYLVWSRVTFYDWLRAKADDFYFEHFDVPEGASPDSPSHVRYTKFGASYWSELKIYPSSDVSREQSVIIVPKN